MTTAGKKSGESRCTDRCPWRRVHRQVSLETLERVAPGWGEGLALAGGETLPVLSEGGRGEKGMTVHAK